MANPYVVTTGTYTGTELALSVNLGFKPALVIAFNQTDGDTVWMFMDGMTDATAMTIAGLTAKVATEGCTFTSTGFTLGTNNVINLTDKVYVYAAFHN